MRVLGIESSCDETAAAVVTDEGVILSDVVASQVKLHAPYGGVVPELASRAHMRNVLPVIDRALADIDRGLGGVDAIAVTQGPGLVGALLVGIQVAKAIALSRDLPLVGVNHLTGHLFSPYLRRVEEPAVNLPFPFMALLVSGGHTALYRVDGPGQRALVSQTRDDAAGEAYDKVGKLLGLGYPGGPVVDRLAAKGDPKAIALPMPLPARSNLEFSFSGLKTAVAHHVRKEGVPSSEAGLADLCASFQRVVVETLVRKSVAACEQEGVENLVITGGVAANRGLRNHATEVCGKVGLHLVIPPFSSCTDNAAMIAYAGALRLLRGEQDDLAIAAYSRDAGFRRGKVA
ncbi:MAG: tRNA (adenosine(37)-N6)-threonylcarbamoyltransferase complex transferase subunit TsaD [Myxococcales bacterium]|nr:tRNA (adenosine(37)-N6)-threonylcarbamoyltransferase complex transferase subunit TsaD [Myxococcales bacterium]